MEVFISAIEGTCSDFKQQFPFSASFVAFQWMNLCSELSMQVQHRERRIKTLKEAQFTSCLSLPISPQHKGQVLE